jgi:rfaE bifunctional protein kinase chain/domain
MKRLSSARAAALLESMAAREVLVVGDVMLDEFLWGKVVRISPEAPVPVVEVTRQSFHVGGAGNVARNIRSLGGAAALAGVVGRDGAAERISEELASAGVESTLTVAPSRPTTVKTRIIAGHQQVVRADREQSDDIQEVLEGDLIARIRRAAARCRAIIVSDYRKGVVTPRVMREVLAVARRRRLPVLVDPKVGHFPLYRGVTVVTPNQLEAEEATGLRIRRASDLAVAGRRLLRQLGCKAALLTRGEHGVSLFERGRPAVHVPTAAREVYDVTGAGDTVIATVALALCAKATLVEAAILANVAAGVAVGKLGTATVTPDEVLAAIDDDPADE